MITEADTCRRYVLPKLYSAGWNDDQIYEQKIFTDGRIIVTGDKFIRRKKKRSDFLLKMRRDFSIAVVEAKSAYKKPGDGLQQAKEYAEILGLKFAYSTNGKGIVEHDFITGKDTDMGSFPTPDELWGRLSKSENITPQIAEILLAPGNTSTGKTPRYYQEIAINRAIKAILQGTKRILLTLATGTGKTFVSFQIIWKLWNNRWNRTGEHRRQLRSKWSNAEQREQIVYLLAQKGITIEQLVEATKKHEADPFDLLCHVAYNAPIRTRKERAEKLKANKKYFFARFGEEARQVLNQMLDKYIEFGTEQLTDMNILKVPPISLHGNLMEISGLFGGTAALRNSIGEMQALLYAD